MANAPILARDDVNVIRGTTAKGSCIARITCESTSSLPTPASPHAAATSAAGTMATIRVTMRRAQGGRRNSRNPSITICPASVPVNVEFWPLARSATANSVLASDAPSTGVSRSYAWWMSATSWLSVPWNAAAAVIRMAALTKNANPSETVESMVARRSASRLPSSVRG